jgi:hypothetical protein
LLCRQYFIFRKKAEGEGRKDYRDCPQRCPVNKVKTYDVFRSDLCKTCPKRKDLEALERAVVASWVKWLGPGLGETLRFTKYMRVLSEVQAAKRYERGTNPVKVSVLLDVYAIEKNWFDDDQRGK